MDTLPDELLLHILSYLNPHELINLHLVSKLFLKVARGSELWRKLTLNEGSYSALARLIRQELLSGGPVPVHDPAIIQLRAAARSAAQNGGGSASEPFVVIPRERSLSDDIVWRPNDAIPAEDFDWYADYVARHAPLSLSWLQPALRDETAYDDDHYEIRGLGVFGAAGEQIVAPREDGSVSIWNVGRDNGPASRICGNIIATSKRGLLTANGTQRPSSSQVTQTSEKAMSTTPVECVSVDRHRCKAYFAVQNGLNEVDLETLQLVSHYRYPSPISALSEIDYPSPLTVGTTLSLHLHDPRWSKNTSSGTDAHDGRLDSGASLPSAGRDSSANFHRLLSGDPSELAAPLSHTCPLSILHLPFSESIKVAGRFPVIMTYDRRTFPKLYGTSYSGAKLSSLACFSSPDRNDLIACGEYNGKGALDMYAIPHSGRYPFSRETSSFNRTSASSSKLLSVSSHGRCIVFSDGDGMLKWVERDGRTLVRRWNINEDVDHELRRGIFAAPSAAASGHVARKIVPFHDGPRSELAVWTGEKIGIVGFRKNPRFGPWQGELLDDQAREEREMQERMRRALERQADEARVVRSLGLGPL
ncbi:MAG: hypothetical protein Q9191_004275 [Dirinaria sp. TL-2023a]